MVCHQGDALEPAHDKESQPVPMGFQWTVRRGGMMATMTSQDDAQVGGTPRDSSEVGGYQVGSDPVFSLKEAAEVAGVSVSTLRRRKAALTEAGAITAETGWQVPMTALIATGLIAGEGGSPALEESSSEGSPEVSKLRERVAELEQLTADLRRRAEVAEAVAAERQRALDIVRLANESERMALRMLTGGMAPANERAEHEDRRADRPKPSPAQESPAPAKPGVWRRMFGGAR